MISPSSPNSFPRRFNNRKFVFNLDAMSTAIPPDEPPLLPEPPPYGADPLPPSPAAAKPHNSKKLVKVREVWSHNLDCEFAIISKIIDDFPFVSMDTEFPGVVFRNQNFPASLDIYQTLKSNVDALKLIQVGITLCDEFGNLPDLGDPDKFFIWEFNFCDFDFASDEHAPSSIQLLRTQGVDFVKNRECGVSTSCFAELMMTSGLLCNDRVTYITFHSGYDFGYLIKAITGKALPESLREFLNLMSVLFGERVYDVKHLMRYCQGLHGGLDKLALSLGVERVAGKCHQAGSDSLLTWHAFQKLRAVYFSKGEKENGLLLDQYAGVLYGLEILDS